MSEPELEPETDSISVGVGIGVVGVEGVGACGALDEQAAQAEHLTGDVGDATCQELRRGEAGELSFTDDVERSVIACPSRHAEDQQGRSARAEKDEARVKGPAVSTLRG